MLSMAPNSRFATFSDLHAADPDTLYFLNYLFRKLRQVPVLVAATIQEEQLSDYPELADLMAEWSATGHVTVTVVPLERAHVGEYVRMMSATGEQADESIIDRLFRLTGGNPFFLREALSLITPAPGSSLAEDVVLPRADAILRRRLARADEMTRHFLRAASVVLDTSDELAPITYVMEGDTKDAIAALNKACDIRLMREGPHGEVSFVHALMQREVYAEMGANQRRYLHARAGEWFGRHGAMASAAFHFEQAGQSGQMVKAGYQAASQAERAGMYHTALMLYQKLRPHVSIEELGPRLAGVLIVLGDWDEADQMIGLLPVEDSSVRLLRSELAFVRGDFDGAQAEAEMALIGSSAERVHVLIRLADIALYLGDFSEAQRYGRSALDLSSTSDANLRARCYGIVAATEYFGGDIQAAGTRFGDALELLEDVPEADRDRVIHSTILANLGTVAETKREWAAAEHHHSEAFRLRREVADARGVLQSLHALGRARLGAGDRDDAERYFTEAEQLAESLGETLRTREDMPHARRAPAARRRRRPRPGTRHQRLGDFHPVAHPLRHHPRQGHAEQSGTRIRAGTPGNTTRSAGAFVGSGHGLRPVVRAVPGGSLRPCRAYRRRSDRLCVRRRARLAVGKPARRKRRRHSTPDRTAARPRGMATRRDLRRHGPDPPDRSPPGRPRRRR